MKNKITIAAIIAVLLISSLFFWIRPKASKTISPRLITKVEYMIAESKPTQITLQSEGILMPKVESQLVSEVSGRVIEIRENFYPGKFFEEGELLFQIDPIDYEDRLKKAELGLAQAELIFLEQSALSEQALLDWQKLDLGTANDLVLRKPQLKQAEKNLASAQANLELATRELSKTRFTAPYSGYLLNRSIDLGTVINGAMSGPVALAYACGDGEVRLSLNEREKALLKAQDVGRNKVRLIHASNNSLLAEGVIDRVEASLNPKNRLFYSVASVKNAFPKEDSMHLSQISRGQYLKAEIDGLILQTAFTVPNVALHRLNTVYVINPENLLVEKQVSVVQSNSHHTIISDGLSDGDRVVISPIAYYVKDMEVEPIKAE
jgi:RND family efflux transporter MFP subunit